MVLVFLIPGCSYFNAFYNTQHYFKKGERERERSTDLNSKPEGYKKSVESGGKLIEFHPKSKYIPEALFIMGQSYYWLEEYHKAQRKFRELIANYPESTYKDDARLWLGKTMVKLKMRQESTSMLRSLISDTKEPELVSNALFALAELYYVDSLFVRAEEEFLHVTDAATDNKVKGEAFLRAGEAAFRMRQYSKAASHYKMALEYELSRKNFFNAQLGYCQSLRFNNDIEKAHDESNKLLKDKRFYEEHGRVRIEKGLALSALGNNEEAIKEFEKIIENHERTPEASRAYYEIGMIRYLEAGKRQESKELFDKAKVERARSEYALKADTMLTRINKVDALTLDRKKTVQRIDQTLIWLENPVDPNDSLALVTAEYYDSLAIDSLKLLKLWNIGWKDSVEIKETIVEINRDSLDTIVDSTLQTVDIEGNNEKIEPISKNDLDSMVVNEFIPGLTQNDELQLLEPEINDPDTIEIVENATADSLLIEEKTDTIQTVEIALFDTIREPIVHRLYDPVPVMDSLSILKNSLQVIRFDLGELLLLDLEQPDSAKAIFRELSEPPNADSVRSRAILALATIAEEDSNLILSDSLMSVLANDFQGTSHGQYARDKLGMSDEHVISPAEEKFLEAEDIYMSGDNYQEAYSLYRWVVETYPESEYSPASLYASAYLAGAKLDDGETAEELINELITNYPASEQSNRAEQLLRKLDQSRMAESMNDTTDISDELAALDLLSEEDVDEIARIDGGIEALASLLESRNLLPIEVIEGTGGEVNLRYTITMDGSAQDFRVVREDPPGRGLARALISGIEQIVIRPAIKEGEAVATRVERTYTLPLDAPPNVRPLPRRSRG